MTIYSTKKEMDKQLLRPRELCVEPGAPDACRVFAFWLRTVEDFIDSLRELRRDGDPEVNRRRIIINCLSPSVYPCVEDAADYEDVVRILKSLYVKQKNVSGAACSTPGLWRISKLYWYSSPPGVLFVAVNFVLLMMLPVSFAVNLDISHVCVSRTQDINPHLLRLSFLSHRSKNRILLALPLVSNLLWLTAYYITFRFISWWTRAHPKISSTSKSARNCT